MQSSFSLSLSLSLSERRSLQESLSVAPSSHSSSYFDSLLTKREATFIENLVSFTPFSLTGCFVITVPSLPLLAHIHIIIILIQGLVLHIIIFNLDLSVVMFLRQPHLHLHLFHLCIQFLLVLHVSTLKLKSFFKILMKLLSFFRRWLFILHFRRSL